MISALTKSISPPKFKIKNFLLDFATSCVNYSGGGKMKKDRIILFILISFILGHVVTLFAQDIVWQDIGRENLNLKTVLVDADKPPILYIGSDKGVLRSEDGGESWRNILLVKGQNKTVNFLLFEPKDKNSLYAASENGLFYSTNQGRDWKRIFQGKNYLENDCTTLAVLSETLYLGTKGGLFVSKDKGRSWHKETTQLGNTHILAIAYNLREPNHTYIACIDGVFKSKDSGQSWERIFITHTIESDSNEEEVTEDQDEEEKSSHLRYITIDQNNANYLYLATSRGVYISQDKGQNWESLSSFGLLNRDVRFLLVSSESHLYAVTESGVFEYINNRWQELSLKLVAGEVRFLALDKQDNLYAACDKGLFKANISYFSSNKQDSIITEYCKDEPKINEIQAAAIKYAEVEPEKISRWRRQAAKRALLPKVTIGMDRDKDKTVSNSIWGTYGSNSSPGKYYIGPDDETRYNNKNWNISLTWELGDLIWSDDQTNIDVRSKLMVQLREDILDEVTKLYFERIRVKMEVDNLNIEERKKRFEKELKLQELTASLDALTGGYFSQQLKNKT